MITGIAHACFTVADLDRSIEFYERLGLQPAFDYRRDGGERFGVYLYVGRRNFIELFVGDVSASAEGQSYRHLCLEVDDLEETIATLRRQGIDASDPKLGTDRSWQAWITDPDGNRIELHQYTAESKQNVSLRS